MINEELDAAAVWMDESPAKLIEAGLFCVEKPKPVVRTFWDVIIDWSVTRPSGSQSVQARMRPACKDGDNLVFAGDVSHVTSMMPKCLVHVYRQGNEIAFKPLLCEAEGSSQARESIAAFEQAKAMAHTLRTLDYTGCVWPPDEDEDEDVPL